MNENNNNTTSTGEMIYFLKEVRARLIKALIVLFVLLIGLLYFANDLYTWLAYPLLKFLPQGHLIATQVVSPFFVPFKLAFMAAFLLTVPFFLYQCWAFITPALYGHERRMLWPFLLISTLLFYSGMAFAYFVIFPLLFQFLTQVAPVGVQLSPDIGEYFDFTIKLLLIFGVLFEIPMIMMLLTKMGVVTRARFIKMRSYAIVGAFVVGMLFAPPDVVSQTLLAVPIWLLYEIGILLARRDVEIS
ncbi:MAG TPA: twin-arginine translocase subunit TatC [Gammaproteobacteria bacterium]|nr:twin-arginine translocase subunit TatC [Gammaproteobacteria bacterium]